MEWCSYPVDKGFPIEIEQGFRNVTSGLVNFSGVNTELNPYSNFPRILLILLNLSCGFVNKVDFNANHKLSPLLTGLDVLEKNQFNKLKGKRIGLITNQTGVNKNLVQNM